MFERLRRLLRGDATNTVGTVGPEVPAPSAQALLDEAMARHQAGDLAGAEAAYRAAQAVDPAHAGIANAFGILLALRGELARAEQQMRSATLLDGGNASFLLNLANVLKARGRLPEAADVYRRSISLAALPEAHYGLANTLQGLRRFDDALDHYRQAVDLRPGYAEAHYNRGLALQALGRNDEAADSYRAAIAAMPGHALAHNNLGLLLLAQGRNEEALASLERAIGCDPRLALIHNNLGSALKAQGRLAEAIASYRRATELDPRYTEAHSNLIFTADLAADWSVAELQAERRRWDACHAAPLAHERRPFPNRRDPERRLRIGYVSADFREHSAMRVFGPMLLDYDRGAFEVYGYANSRREDRYTQRFAAAATAWRNVVDLSDAALAEQVRADAIDILVDLSGHSAGNRLLAFARKPAPVQATAWGYATGTGMAAMDAFLADPVMVPPAERGMFAEDVRYLPSVVCYYADREFPPLEPLPAAGGGGVTFGSLNRLEKVTPAAFDLWAQVLAAVPGSRLLLKAGELDDAATRRRVADRFSAAGIDAGRLILLGKSSWEDHIAAFNRLDIALDPFPHGGGVTALEGLLMGVPVVTLRWPTTAGRLSASILTTLGLDDWIAETADEYVAVAIAHAAHLHELAELRMQLRQRFNVSIIGDTQAYVKAVEGEYRRLWREWCARAAAGDAQQ